MTKNKPEILNTLDIAKSLKKTLTIARESVVAGFPEGVEIDSRNFEDELEKQINKDEWDSEECLSLSALFFALSVEEAVIDRDEEPGEEIDEDDEDDEEL